MITKTLKLILALFLISTVNFKAQPYIYYSVQLPDTGFEHYSKVIRYDLASNSVEDFLPQQNIGEYVWETWDPSQLFLAINVFKWTHTIYNCSDTTNYFELEEFFNVSFDEILYSLQRNKLYLFSNDYAVISVFDVASENFTSELNLGKTAYYNILMKPSRCSFFSSDSSKIYFFNVDTNDVDQVWTYSLETNQIVNKQNLLELGGHSGSLGYSLVFGRNGKGIIQSYPVFYGNPDQDFYYKLYDFDADTSSSFIYHDGECEAYFSGNGEFILIFETYSDTLNDSLSYYHTGEVEIYNPGNGELVKTLTLPSYGIVYTFDNYPNNIYYAIDIEEPTRQIYTLKMDSIFNVLDLTSLNPVSAIVNSASFTLTVNGHGFDTLSTVYFNETVKTTTYISDSVLTAEIDSSDISVVGSYPVWVKDKWGTSDTLTFTVFQLPVLTSISPEITIMPEFVATTLYVPEFNFTLTLTGDFFTDSSIIYFNNEQMETAFIFDTIITCQITESHISAITTGDYSVWVSNYGFNSDTLLLTSVDNLPESIVPVLNCVQDNGDDNYTAWLGYISDNSTSVHIGYGEKNMFWHCYSLNNFINRGQPNIFLPGEHNFVFAIEFTTASSPPCADYYKWILDSGDVNAADSKADECE